VMQRTAIDEYLARLRRALRVDLPAQERILCEVEDHLWEGAEREAEQGVPREEAQRHVIARFGAPDVVAVWWEEVYGGDEGGKSMWQQFTERAREAVFFAQEEAARMGENYVGTEHLLLALVVGKNPDSIWHRGIAAGLLVRLGVSLEQIRREVERQVTRGPAPIAVEQAEPQLTPGAKQAIDLAYEEALRLGNNYIGTEHLLIGLLRQKSGLGGKVLRELGVDAERVLQQLPGVCEKHGAIAEASRRLQQAKDAYCAFVAGVEG
jgi:Clp amino terminal domain, pathogenicity island component